MDVIKLIATILVAALGAFIAKKLKVPAAYMLGAMLAVALFNIVTADAFMPKSIKVFTQAISGTYIGVSLKRKDLASLKQLALPVVILVTIYLLFTAVGGLVLHYAFSVDIRTAFLMVIPGGVADTTLMAYDLDADPAKVSFIQSLRLFSAYMIYPTLVPMIVKDIKTVDLDSPVSDTKVNYFFDRFVPDSKLWQHVITIAIGCTAGYLGKLSGLPAGTLSFSMIAVILFNINCSKIKLDRKYKNYVQIIAGALVGATMTSEILINLKSLLIPAIFVICSYVVIVLTIGYLMSKTKKIDLASAMFASTPGGASDMALVVTDLGGDAPKIAVIQVIRLVACYAIFPIWVKFLIGIFE